MMELRNDLRRVMDEMSRERGPFTFFGMFLRQEAPNRWDLVVSAPWLEQGRLKALQEFSTRLRSIVGDDQLLTISRVVTLNHDDPALEAVLRAVVVDDEPVEFRNRDFFGMPMREAVIARAKNPDIRFLGGGS